MTTENDLERDIAASRARLEGMLGKLGERLTGSGIVEDMLGTARRSEVGAGLYDGALDAVRRNPLPILLICAGAGMLIRAMAKPPPRASGRRVRIYTDQGVSLPRTRQSPSLTAISGR